MINFDRVDINKSLESFNPYFFMAKEMVKVVYTVSGAVEKLAEPFFKRESKNEKPPELESDRISREKFPLYPIYE